MPFLLLVVDIISIGPATKKLKQGVSNGVWGYLLFSKYAVLAANSFKGKRHPSECRALT